MKEYTIGRVVRLNSESGYKDILPYGHIVGFSANVFNEPILIVNFGTKCKIGEIDPPEPTKITIHPSNVTVL